MNRSTGERRNHPPQASVESLKPSVLGAPYMKKTHIVVESEAITTHEYVKEVKTTRKEIGIMMKELAAVALIAISFRRKVALKRRIKQQRELKFKRIIYRFMVQNIRFIDHIRKKRHERVTRIQAVWRGYKFRSFFYSGGEYVTRWYKMKALQLSMMIYRIWRKYKLLRVVTKMISINAVPNTFEDWLMIVQRSRYIRSVGLYDEYRWKDFFIYQHHVTKICTFTKPMEIKNYDKQQILERSLLGYSSRQITLVIKLQALARGWQVRSNHLLQAKAYDIADTALELYLKHPEIDENLYRYALYCHVAVNDIVRARHLYVECFRRMKDKGPDNPFILYSYAIFVFVNQEADFGDIQALIARAQTAESSAELRRKNRRGMTELKKIRNFGKTFRVARVGFFQRYAETHNTCLSWHQYAACLFLVYNLFEDSFAAFVRALDCDALNRPARENLNLVLDRHFGDDVDRKLELLQNFSRRYGQLPS